MAHDVFISYASEDKPIADAVCATLEAQGIRCWIAPRDVTPGASYGGSIIGAINASQVFVLVFSSSANASPQVMREVERGANKGLPIIPFRIEDTPLSADMEYYISAPHWLDALTPPREKYLQQLTETVQLLLTRGDSQSPAGAREQQPKLAARREEGPARPAAAAAGRKVGYIAANAALLSIAVLFGTWSLWHTQRPTRPAPLQESAVDVCMQHLQAIGRALNAYQRDHGELPPHLSDLYPVYLADKKLFHCPADPSPGKVGLGDWPDDPQMPISYLYEMSLDRLDSSSLLGPISNKPTTRRDWKLAQRVQFGDRVPVVTCWHHVDPSTQPPPSDHQPWHLYLTLTGQVYRSLNIWENDPETVSVVLARMEQDLAAGPEQFQRRWLPDRIADYFLSASSIDAFRDRCRGAAEKLASMARVSAGKSAGDLSAAAGSLYRAAGDTDKATTACEAALRMPGQRPFSTYWILADLYHQTGKHKESIALLQQRLARDPKNGSYIQLLVLNYEATGQKDKADTWRRKLQ